MNRFIYVFTDKAKVTLLERGYNLIRSDIQNNVFVFENMHPDKLEFSLEFPHVLSSTLSF